MKQTFAWIVGTVVMVLLCYVAVEIRDRVLPDGTAPPEFAPVVETLRFDDGWKIELIQLGVERIDDTRHIPSSGGMFGFGGSSSSSGSSGGMGIGCQYERENGELISLGFEGSKGSLMLELIVTKSSGSPPRKIHTLYENDVYEITANSSSRKEEFAGVEAMLDKRPDTLHPDLMIQIADSDGEWHCGYGPVIHEEDPEGRGAATFPIWPRTVDELRFRAIRPGLEPIEFTLPNPAYSSTPEPWSAKPTPVKVSNKDFTFHLQGVRASDRHSVHPQIITDTSVVSKVSKNGHVIENAYDAWFRGVTGPYGSESGSYLPDPSENPLKLAFTISPTDVFPVAAGDVVMIAELKVNNEGQLSPFTELAGASHGIHFTTAELRQKRQQLGLTLNCVWRNRGEIAAGEKLIGDWQKAALYCFVDGELEATKRARCHGGGSSRSGGRAEFDRRYSFNFEEPLIPGTIIRFGLAQPPTNHSIEVCIDRSEITE